MILIKPEFLIVTNNPVVNERLSNKFEVKFIAGEYQEVLNVGRNLVHAGHELLTHPMAGSIKPNETPYKSILLTKRRQSLDFQSLQIIEESIQVCEKFSNYIREYPQEVLTDFQQIDSSLIENAIASATV